MQGEAFQVAEPWHYGLVHMRAGGIGMTRGADSGDE